MEDIPVSGGWGLSLLLAAIPTLLYALLVWRIDRYEREPLRLMLTAFLWGAIPAAVGAAIVGTLLSAPLAALPEPTYEMASSSLVAPPVEETIKAMALWGLYHWARQEFDDALDGVVYGSLIGFGFAMTENVLYFMSSRESVSQFAAVVLGRAVAFGLNHAMYTSFTGAAFGAAIAMHGRGRRALTILLGLMVAIGAHFAHNFIMTASGLCLPALLVDWAGVAVVFIIVVLSWSRERQVIQSELAAEVEAGVMTAAQVDDVRTRRKRLARTWRAAGAAGASQARSWRRFTDSAVELAFALRRQRRDRPGAPERVVELRRRVLLQRQVLGDETAQAQLACATCGRPLQANGECAHCRTRA